MERSNIRMNVLFLTLVEINSIDERGIYQDLLRTFLSEGHHVTVVTPLERRRKIASNLKSSKKLNILQVKTFNIQKTNILEKGIGTLAIEYQYLNSIKKHLGLIKFDLILYSTPPITLTKVIEYIKRRDSAYSYLLLKDIFPQNAVDMQMMKPEGLIHRLFVKKEKRLYQISDTIGCMSEANKKYIIRLNPEINPSKIEVNPNSILPIQMNLNEDTKSKIRTKYNIPLHKKVFVYGGNLGKPQGLDFLLETIKTNKNETVFFLIIGSGTEYKRIEKWFFINKPPNAILLSSLPKNDFDYLLATCDVGLIFLNKDFLIPNFPSRLLSYLEMKLPVLAATDSNSDIGDIIENAECGYKVVSGDIQQMNVTINKLASEDDLYTMGTNSWTLLQNEFLIEKSYNLISEKIVHEK